MPLKRVPSRAAARLAVVRPLPQIRVLRTYGVSPLHRPLDSLRYLLFDRETSNFTYDIANRDELVAILADAMRTAPATIAGYVAEIDGDDELVRRLESRMRRRRDSNRRAFFGRRIGWYVVARRLKPRLAVETGTADGLGTALLARALERNTAEGARGELLSFDLDADAGWLLGPESSRLVRLVVGDTRETLPRELEGRAVDLFVHDSLHTYEHELFELRVARRHRAPRQVLISDNAHVTTALAELAEQEKMTFRLFRERPLRHFYPGAGLGIAVSPPG